MYDIAPVTARAVVANVPAGVDLVSLQAFADFIHEAADYATSDFEGDRGALQIIGIIPDGPTHVLGRVEIGETQQTVDLALKGVRDGYNVYVEPRTVARSVTGLSRGVSADTIAVFAFVVDNDVDKGLAAETRGEPSLIVQTSGRNTHQWYALESSIEYSEQSERIGRRMRLAGADSATGKICQPYRFAGTPNIPHAAKRKAGRKAEPTLVLEQSGVRYVVDEFEALWPEDTGPNAMFDGDLPPEPSFTQEEVEALIARCPRSILEKLKTPADECISKQTGRRDRSGHFQSVNGLLKKHGFSAEEAFALWEEHPDSAAEKFESRLWKETWRSFAKAKAPLANGVKAASEPANGNAEVLPPDVDVLTEDAGAEAFVEKFKGKIRYDWDRGAWFGFDGAHWRLDRAGRAFHFARVMVRDLSRKKLPAVRFITEKASFAGNVERFARADPAVAVTSEIWDADPWLLGTPGGTYDLRAGKLRRADPSDNITKLTGATPTTTADCPRFLAFIHEATRGDEDLAEYLQLWGGYCLTGVTTEQKLTFLFGGGGNGKGLFYGAMLHAVGAYGKTAAFSTFVASRNEQHPTDLARLHGARMVVASEVDAKQTFAEARVKSLTGGDPIAARYMQKDFFEFTPVAKITLVGNSLPRLSNVDDAARRRFRIVPFVNKPRVVDQTLADVFQAEAGGILAWMIEGCLKWQKTGLPYPAAIRELTEGYFTEQDVIGDWFGSHVELAGRGDVIPSSQLFESWRSYAKRMGEDPGDQRRFAAAMEQRGVERDRTKSARIFRGVRFRSQAEEEAG